MIIKSCALALANFLGAPLDMVKKVEEKVYTLASTPQEAKDFFVVVAIESRFNPKALNPSGAKGLSQLTEIGVKEVRSKGVKCRLRNSPDTLVGNVEHGFCYFKLMRELNSGDTQLALVAYNAGNSRASSFKKNLSLPTETAHYLAKFNYLRRNICR
jgi:soluble lytic murein transglycosylase-like protein